MPLFIVINTSSLYQTCIILTTDVIIFSDVAFPTVLLMQFYGILSERLPQTHVHVAVDVTR